MTLLELILILSNEFYVSQGLNRILIEMITHSTFMPPRNSVHCNR